MQIKCLILLFCFSSNVFADTHLIITLTSKHSDKTYISTNNIETEYNDDNFGLGIAYDINNNIQARVGFYDNSYYNISVYAGGSLHTNINKPFAIGIQAGLVHGYKGSYKNDNITKLMFMALPFIQLRYENVALEVGYIPKQVSEVSLATLSVTVEF